MTVLSILTIATALLGFALWRGWVCPSLPEFRPVVALLAWVPIADLAKWALDRRLAGHAVPYSWPESGLLAIHGAFFLSEPIAILAAACVAHLGWRLQTFTVGWLALSLVSWAAYPELRDGPRLATYGVISAALAVVAMGVGRYRMALSSRTVYLSLQMLAVGELGSSLAYVRGDAQRDWDVARAAFAAAYALLSCYLVIVIAKRRRRPAVRGVDSRTH